MVVRVREWRRTTRRKGLVVRVSADMVDREEAILFEIVRTGSLRDYVESFGGFVSRITQQMSSLVLVEPLDINRSLDFLLDGSLSLVSRLGKRNTTRFYLTQSHKTQSARHETLVAFRVSSHPCACTRLKGRTIAI